MVSTLRASLHTYAFHLSTATRAFEPALFMKHTSFGTPTLQASDSCRSSVSRLLGQENVLTGLSHWSIWGGDHKDSAIHLACSWPEIDGFLDSLHVGLGWLKQVLQSCDHVLHVVRVSRAVHVAVVPAPTPLNCLLKLAPVLRLILDVRGVDRDTAGTLLWSVVNLLHRYPLLTYPQDHESLHKQSSIHGKT